MPGLNLLQIVRLRGIFRKWRLLALKSRSLSATFSSSSLSTSSPPPPPPPCPRVPPGHLAVYVGPERERFVIKTSLLAHPLFKALLKKTEAEVGFRYAGGLTIPCNISAFRSLLHLMQGGKRVRQVRTPATGAFRNNGLSKLVDASGACNHEELRLLLQELQCLLGMDLSSQSPARCVPDSRLNPLVDTALQEPICG